MPKVFDEIDRQIIQILEFDARRSLADIGKEVSLSGPAVGERMRALVDNGFITCFGAQLNLQRFGFAIQALVRIKPRSGQLHFVEKMIEEQPRIISCDRVTGAYPFVLQRFSEPVSVIAAIPEQPFDLWQAAQQSSCANVIADLSSGDEQVDWSSLAVTDCVQLGVHAALGSTDQASTPPFLTAMLVAVRWAFRYVASIITVVFSPCFAASPAIIRAKMPFSLQRFQRL